MLAPNPLSLATLPELRYVQPQTRGYVVNLVRSLSPTSLELEVRRVASAGFNLLVFPVYNNGWTLYPSESARSWGIKRINPIFRRWDPLATVTRLAREEGLGIWGFARPYNFHPRFSVAEHKLLYRYPQWRLRAHPNFGSAETRRYEQWHPCPINHEYRRFVGDLMTELVSAYPIDGLVMNYTSYGLHGGPLPGFPYCFCDSCQTLYAETHDEAQLQRDAMNPELLPRVRGWQLRQSHESLLYLRHRILRTRRTLRLLCRARPHWRDSPPEDEDIARADIRLLDWPSLLQSGSVDALLVDHDDEPVGPHFGSRLAADMAFLGDRVLSLPVYSLNQPAEIRFPLRLYYRYPVSGFIAEFQRSFTQEEAFDIRRNFFEEPATVTESSPVQSAVWLLDQVRMRHAAHEPLASLMTDMLRILARQMPIADDFDGLLVLEQNLMGLEQFIRRGRLHPERVSDDTLRHLGLARRLLRMAALDVRA